MQVKELHCLKFLVMSFCYAGAPTRGVCSITFDVKHKFMCKNLPELQQIEDMDP